MILQDLQIHSVRNLKNLRLTLHPRFTLIVGDNGRGKTAILEALYLLGRGHSFRSHEIAPIITHGEKQLTVFARAEDNASISIQKSSASPTLVKLNNQPCASSSQLAQALPSQLFYQDLFELMDSGSAMRRNLLDWGLFHVKHHYLPLWKTYKRLLQQRNALLKQQAKRSLLLPWDQQLAEAAEKIDELRKTYFANWDAAFQHLLPSLTNIDCSIEYFKGWDKKNSGKNLPTLLDENYESDIHRQYTQQGAHQADIIIKTASHFDSPDKSAATTPTNIFSLSDSQDLPGRLTENMKSGTHSAKKMLSRGQQKMILTALKLSQAELFTGDCLYLLDDYSAELDLNHQNRLLNHLAQRKGQYVLTSTQPQNLDNIFGKENFTVINL